MTKCMKFKSILALALLAGIAITSCKKTEESTGLPSLTGLSVTNNATTYVRVGAKLTFTANVSGITPSDNSTPGTIGLYWQVNTADRDTLTRDISVSVPQFHYTVDTLGSYTVYCYAYASNYYNASASTAFKAIDPETALTGLAGERTETLDGKRFRTVEVDGKTWLAENYYGGGHQYRSCEVLDSVLGNYYTWEEAQSVCPGGWHLPTGEEFDALGSSAGSLMADAVFLSDAMWEYWPGMVITNEKGFNAIPAGYLDLGNTTQEQGFCEYALWWTADPVDDQLAAFRFIYEDKPLVQKGQGSKTSLALNVRCVKD